MSIEFLITSLVVVLLPGTGVIYTIAVGLGRGFRPSLAAAFGCTLGIVPAALASIAGLAALLHTSALAFQAIKFLGVLYLFYMAWSVLKDKGVMEVPENEDRSDFVQVAITGTLLNVLNPKLSLFFLAFLPQFVSSTGPDTTAELVGLAAVFMSMTFVIFVCYGAFASFAREYVIQRPSVMRWVRRCFAGTFGFLGAKLAFSD